jgi:hypothetical protein
MTIEAVVNLVLGSGLKDLSIRVAQSGDRAGLAAVIALGTGGIVGALVMIPGCRHVIKTVNDIRTHKEVSMSGVVGRAGMTFLAFDRVETGR